MNICDFFTFFTFSAFENTQLLTKVAWVIHETLRLILSSKTLCTLNCSCLLRKHPNHLPDHLLLCVVCDLLFQKDKMNISHELFSCFAFYSGVVLTKTLIMSFWTAKRRFGSGVSIILDIVLMSRPDKFGLWSILSILSVLTILLVWKLCQIIQSCRFQ